MIKIIDSGKYKHFALIKTKDNIILECLSAKIAFDSLKTTGYKKLIVTSGSLRPKEITEHSTGLKL